MKIEEVLKYRLNLGNRFHIETLLLSLYSQIKDEDPCAKVFVSGSHKGGIEIGLH